MSLYESGDSNGEISLSKLFENPSIFESCHSTLSIDEIKKVICRGGWPRSINILDRKAQYRIAKDIFDQTCDTDISRIDDVEKNPILAKTILKSYARNICAEADTIILVSAFLFFIEIVLI